MKKKRKNLYMEKRKEERSRQIGRFQLFILVTVSFYKNKTKMAKEKIYIKKKRNI